LVWHLSSPWPGWHCPRSGGTGTLPARRPGQCGRARPSKWRALTRRAAPPHRDTEMWSVTLPNPYNWSFSYYWACILTMIIYIPGEWALAGAGRGPSLQARLLAGVCVPSACPPAGCRPAPAVRLPAGQQAQGPGKRYQEDEGCMIKQHRGVTELLAGRTRAARLAACCPQPASCSGTALLPSELT
jgi:hypothetical protein